MSPNRAKLPTETTRVATADVPALVKLAYLLIGCASLAYFLLHMRHGSTLAAAANEASLGLVYGVAGLIVVFGVTVVALSFRRGR
ncbi:MAG TPA: hypothetical protein VLY24_00040 [Bryobacteraceae bacterium]|nr:hypothetical protein [Bryobacteraceae bacterium]